MTMSATNFTLLQRALRSDDYKQITEKLRGLYTEEDDYGNIVEQYVGHCCLGVYCEVRGIDLSTYGFNGAYEDECQLEDFGGVEDGEIAPSPLDAVLGDFTEDQRKYLARMNDDGRSFVEIADYLEAHRSEFVDGVE